MPSVSIDLLTLPQRNKCKQQTDRFIDDGVLSNTNKLHSHCPRCRELWGVEQAVKPIEEFNLWASQTDGCSTYCTNCLHTDLNAKESKRAFGLFCEYAPEVLFEKELYLYIGDGTTSDKADWMLAKHVGSPKEVLKKSVELLRNYEKRMIDAEKKQPSPLITDDKDAPAIKRWGDSDDDVPPLPTAFWVMLVIVLGVSLFLFLGG